MSRVQPTDAEVEAVLDKLRERLGTDYDALQTLRAYERKSVEGVCATIVEPDDDPEGSSCSTGG